MSNCHISYVSVIIPVYNDCKRLNKCLQSLENQSYPKELYEVIVVDNNSSENIESITSQFQQVKLGFEANRGSYAARNQGIALAKGEIFAFIDSDCLPVPQWIENGVKTLESESADLVGGNVKFTFSPQKSLAEFYDSITNMQIKKNIESRQVSKTANLFVRKGVFDLVGLFPSHLKSGGDVIWTKKATDANLKLVYSSSAEVFHPARRLIPLMKKQYRVGGGQPDIWLEEGQSLKQIFIYCLKSFRPPSARKFWKLTSQTDIEEIRGKFVLMLLIAWLCETTTNLGRLNNIFKRTITSKQ
ncbi:MAG: glycosyltransferase [Mastigocoleus sp. MO_167.B18]|nr:glycosyltransferase [Mastigocoleus sp. MO_167.B18]